MEIWKSIKGYEGIYEVSNLGRVKVLERAAKGRFNNIHVFKEKILKPINQTNGYLKVNLIKNATQKTVLIHRIVAIAFIQGDNSLTVNHINGIKTDNRVQNLEWVTLSENHKHAFRLGLKCLKGEKCTTNKLFEHQVIEIKKMLDQGITHQKIADLYKVKRQTITDINLKRRWSHI
jgi:hypothetical protein